MANVCSCKEEEVSSAWIPKVNFFNSRNMFRSSFFGRFKYIHVCISEKKMWENFVFFFVYIPFTSQSFLLIFIVWKRGDPIADFISICIKKIVVLLLVISPLIWFCYYWLSCYKWQFALNVFFVFFITTQAVT